MLRRLYHTQPDSFDFAPGNLSWANAQITKYPEGRQASAVIPLLWRAQEQEGWVTRPAIEAIADMLGMAHIRVLEVASFYFMFQLQPVGEVAHIQICGTTSCMICGAEDLIGVCKDKIAANPHEISADGKFSWEEVECLGACTNAPMAQIGKDYYEDLTAENFAGLLDEFAAGKVPPPGPMNGRHGSEPLGGRTSLLGGKNVHALNASATLADDKGDTIARIDGSEEKLVKPAKVKATPKTKKPPQKASASSTKAKVAKPIAAKSSTKPKADTGSNTTAQQKPKGLKAARGGSADDLKRIKGVGPKLEKLLHSLGFFHFDQVAAWSKKEVAWVDENLVGFKGRVSRDEWVKQAKKFAAEN